MAGKKSTLSISTLRRTFKHVIMPDDVDDDKARTVVAGDINRRPAVIIKVTNANEVAGVISLAFEKSIQQGDKGAYVNFINSVGEEQLRAAYPGSTLEKLHQVKAKYDPTNLFRMNQNISPKKS